MPLCTSSGRCNLMPIFILNSAFICVNMLHLSAILPNYVIPYSILLLCQPDKLHCASNMRLCYECRKANITYLNLLMKFEQCRINSGTDYYIIQKLTQHIASCILTEYCILAKLTLTTMMMMSSNNNRCGLGVATPPTPMFQFAC